MENNDYNSFIKMLESQIKLNDLIKPDWKVTLTKEDFLFAAFVEAGEAGASLAYKWWKKGESDWDNFKVEVIDILHFLLSALSYNDDPDINDAIYYMRNGIGAIKADTVINESDKISKAKDALINLLKRDEVTAFYYLGQLCKIAGYNKITDIAKDFVTKNVLNKFRTLRGYQDGSYIKNWVDVEDNVVAFKFAKELKFNKWFEENLYNKLEQYYITEVKNF